MPRKCVWCCFSDAVFLHVFVFLISCFLNVFIFFRLEIEFKNICKLLEFYNITWYKLVNGSRSQFADKKEQNLHCECFEEKGKIWMRKVDKERYGGKGKFIGEWWLFFVNLPMGFFCCCCICIVLFMGLDSWKQHNQKDNLEISIDFGNSLNGFFFILFLCIFGGMHFTLHSFSHTLTNPYPFLFRIINQCTIPFANVEIVRPSGRQIRHWSLVDDDNDQRWRRLLLWRFFFFCITIVLCYIFQALFFLLLLYSSFCAVCLKRWKMLNI